MTRKSGEHLCTTYGNTVQLFRPYYFYTLLRRQGHLQGNVFPGLGGDHVFCKMYGCNLQDIFRLIGHAITMTNLALLVCDVDLWLSGRVLALHSVVTGLSSSGGDHGVHCWWDLIRSKQLSSISVCHSKFDFLLKQNFFQQLN